MREDPPIDVDALLQEMVRRDASDLHVTAGARPKLRVDGELRDSETEWIPTSADTARLASALLTERLRERFERDREADFVFEVEDLSRFRGNCFRQRGRVAVALRRIPSRIPRVDTLGLPLAAGRLVERPRGLILVTGPTGSGKSTTLAALVDKINRERRSHIVTIEDPIEFVHASRRCIVNQREIGADTKSFASALRHALRQDPDIVMIGELRDLETTRAALATAETGHLVLASLHTNSAAESVHRIVDIFPAHQQDQVRTLLAFVLEGVVTQVLLPRLRGGGRTVAAEILVCTPAVRAVIRDDKVHQIHSLMQAGKKHGMQTLNDALQKLYMSGEVSLEEAVQRSSDPGALLRAVGEPLPDDA